MVLDQRIAAPQRQRRVADREAAAPDRVDSSDGQAPRWRSAELIAGSAQRWRVRSSVNCAPGECLAKRSSMPILKKNARSWWRTTMPAATGVPPACSVMISQRPVSAIADVARRMKAASPACWLSAVPRLPLSSHRPRGRGRSRAPRRRRAACVRHRTAPRRVRTGDGAGAAAPSASSIRARRAAGRRQRASHRAVALIGAQHAGLQTVPRASTARIAVMAGPSSDMVRRISACAPALRACCNNLPTACSAASRSSSGVHNVP